MVSLTVLPQLFFLQFLQHGGKKRDKVKQELGSTTASSKRRKGSLGGSSAGDSSEKRESGLSQEVSKVDKILLLNPWLTTVIERFEKEWSEFGDVTQILYHYMPDAGAQREWSAFLASTFPPDPDKKYMASHEVPFGRQYIRPYMWSWDRQHGNKGFIDKTHFKNLLTLVLTRGFNTNPDIPGTELPLICKPQDELQADGGIVCAEVESAPWRV